MSFEFPQFALPVVDSDGLPVTSEKLGLGIEAVDVRNATGHVQENDTVGPGSMMWIPWSQGVDRTTTTHRGKPLRESTGQRQRTKPTRTTGQGLPAAGLTVDLDNS